MQGCRSWQRSSTLLLLGISALAGYQAHGEYSSARVYECWQQGQRVFSDQPCSADAATRDITIQNQMKANEARIDYHADSKHSPRKVTDDATDSRAERREHCAKLDSKKQQLNSRMRAGYKAAQGERLREQLRQVDTKLYELRCSSL